MEFVIEVIEDEPVNMITTVPFRGVMRFIPKDMPEEDIERVKEEMTQAIFNKIQKRLLETLAHKYDEFNKRLREKYPQAEVATFSQKATEALAWRADNSAPTPFIDKLALAAGIGREEYLSSVLENVDLIAEKEGRMLSLRNAIKSATTVEELEKIEIKL